MRPFLILQQKCDPANDFGIAGRVDARAEGGALPSMASALPSLGTLATWNRASQDAFWLQRKQAWGRRGLKEVQRACRAKGLWPGGDLPFLRDRLARSEFGPAALTREDTKTEADAQEEAQRRLYYAVIGWDAN